MFKIFKAKSTPQMVSKLAASLQSCNIRKHSIYCQDERMGTTYLWQYLYLEEIA